MPILIWTLIRCWLRDTIWSTQLFYFWILCFYLIRKLRLKILYLLFLPILQSLIFLLKRLKFIMQFLELLINLFFFFFHLFNNIFMFHCHLIQILLCFCEMKCISSFFLIQCFYLIFKLALLISKFLYLIDLLIVLGFKLAYLLLRRLLLAHKSTFKTFKLFRIVQVFLYLFFIFRFQNGIILLVLVNLLLLGFDLFFKIRVFCL